MPSTEDLKKRVAERHAALEAEHTRAAPTEREKIIRQAIDSVYSMDFYCDRCQADFQATGRKTVQRIFEPAIAFYEARCRCRAWCRRYITDQSIDPYYRKSRRLREMAERFRKDILQPGDPGFQILYGDPYAKFYEQLEKQERAIWNRKSSIQV